MARQRRAITTDKAAPPGAHYSQAIVAGDHVYVSGSGPFEPVTHKHFPTEPPARTALAVAGMRPAGRLLVMDAVAYTGPGARS